MGPSDMIALSDLDQVFTLTIGLCAGLASIWDSVSEYRDAIRSHRLLSESSVGLLEGIELAESEQKNTHVDAGRTTRRASV